MKRFFSMLFLIVEIIMIFGNTLAENTEENLKRAKSWDLTQTEWLDRFNSTSELYGDSLQINSLLPVSESNYRKTYVAIINDYLSLGIMCEDTTDKVYAATVMLNLEGAPNNSELGKQIGRIFSGCIRRIIYACDKTISASDVEILYNKLTPAEIITSANSSAKINERGNQYVLLNSADGAHITFVMSKDDTFESEEEFLKYRESTISSEIEPKSTDNETLEESNIGKILFRGIPWGNDIDTVENTLSSFTYHEYEQKLLSFDGYRPYSSEKSEYVNGLVVSFEPKEVDFNVGGYKCKSFSCYFAYGLSADGIVSKERKDTRFYMGVYRLDVVDVETAYEILKDKLTGLYGEGIYDDGYIDRIAGTIYDEYATVWYGIEDTAVMICAQVEKGDNTSNNKLEIIYGLYDSNLMLEELDRAIYEEMRQAEAANVSDGIDGL